MVSSRWQKQNSSMFNIAFSILFVSIITMGLPAVLLGLEGVVALFATVFGFIITVVIAFVLIRRQANSMVRVVKFNYKSIERDFRVLFKDKSIHFNRKVEDDSFRYNFPGHALSMIIQPYELLNLGYKGQKKAIIPATKITLRDLSSKNEHFAEELANLIDGMAELLVTSSVKA